MRKQTRKIGSKIKGLTIIGYSSKIAKSGKRIGYYSLLCNKCNLTFECRADNLQKLVNCKCQSRHQFKEIDFNPKDKQYSEQEIRNLARRYKVSPDNIIGILKRHNIIYQDVEKGGLTEKEKHLAQSYAKIGYSKSEIAAKINTDIKEVSVETISKFSHREKIAASYKELRCEHGYTLKEIAKEMQVHETTVFNLLKEFYGETFVKEAHKKRQQKIKSASNKFLMKSDHRLSQSALRRKK